MQLDEALQQIDEIHRHMAAGRIFRGYRSISTATSGLIALAAAALQAWMIPNPQQAIVAYLALWVTAASLCIIVIAVGLAARYGLRSPLHKQLTSLAIEHLLPSLFAGALLTATLWRYAPESLWMLPGLWAILFSLGIFASSRLLPAATWGVASYYLLAGLLVLILARGQHALSPWAMALTFGVGQLVAAAVLYWTLERNNARKAR